MPESTTIILPKAMPVAQRIPGVSKQISEWLESLEKPFNLEKDALHLAKYEKNAKSYSYHYVLDRNIKSLRKR
jgi:hypothetical protein